MLNRPRVVLGGPLFNAADHLPEALDSLLGQTYREFHLVLVDDRSSDETGDVVTAVQKRDSRVTYVVNEERLGLTRNWRATFETAMRSVPDAEYFAWVSDHDFWHPRWLEVLVETLDRRPDAVLAYPRAAVLRDGGVLQLRPPSLDTTGTVGRSARMRRLTHEMRAGYMVYGLARAGAVRRAGGFRHVLYADRLVLTELAQQGELVEVPEVLWYKRPTAEKFSVERQRRACFPDGEPRYARLPWYLTHAGALAWAGPRRGGLASGASYARHAVTQQWESRLRKRVKQARGRGRLAARVLDGLKR